MGWIESLISCSTLSNTDLLSAKLPSVPEEYIPDDMFRGRNVGFLAIQQETTVPQTQISQPQAVVQQPMEQAPTDSPLQYTATIFAQPETDANFRTFGPGSVQRGAYVTNMTETYGFCRLCCSSAYSFIVDDSCHFLTFRCHCFCIVFVWKSLFLHSVVFLVSAAGQTAYDDVSSVSKVRTLRSSQRSHPQHQQNQQGHPAPLPITQQSNTLFQQQPPAPQQQVVLCSSPQYLHQAFSMSDLGSSSSPSHSPPSQPPQLPSYALSSQGAQCYKQPYQRTSPQQQASFPSFRLASSPAAISHSPTPGSEPPSLRQSITSPTVKSPSLRSNSLPGLQDDTFVMPKVSTMITPVFVACLLFCATFVHVWSTQMLLRSPHKAQDVRILSSSFPNL
jgi:hypothetical protein